jgi:hypothetical protein
MREPWRCLQAEPAQPGNLFLSRKPANGSRVSLKRQIMHVARVPRSFAAIFYLVARAGDGCGANSVGQCLG